MAKKKQTETASLPESADRASYVASALAEIEKNFGAGIARSGREVVDSPPAVIPFSPALDGILGGGVPEGSWVSVSGIEKSGKSLSLLSFAANCQKPEYGARPVMLLAAEHRGDALLLNGIRGLKLEPPWFYLVQSTKGKVLSSVDFLNIGLTFLKTVPGGVLIIDSISALVNPQTITNGLGSSDHGSGNRIIGQFIDLAVPAVKANGCIACGVVQLYANTSGYGKHVNEKAARKWFYQCDIRLDVGKYVFDYGNGEDEPPTGQTVSWLCRKAALTGPGAKTESFIRFGTGIDRVKELIVRGRDFGLVEQAGSWMTLSFLANREDLRNGKDEVKVQGLEKAYQLLEENVEMYQELERQVREFMSPSPVEAEMESA